MDKLLQYITKLDNLTVEVLAKREQMQTAAEALSTAVAAGKGDFGRLGIEFSEAGRVYDEAHARTIEFVGDAQKHLLAKARAAQKRGVSLPEHLVEDSSPQEYSTPELIETINQIRAGMQALTEAVETFNALQAQLGEAFEKLKTELDRLERLDAKSADSLTKVLENLKIRFANLEEPREPLLRDVQALLDTCHERAEEVLERRIRKTHAEIKAILDRLDALKAKSPDDGRKLEGLEARLDLPDSRELLLGDSRAFFNSLQDHIKEATAKLDARCEELVKQATEVLAEIHPGVPEALALVALLEQRETIQEAELVSYLAKLETNVEEAHNAGLNVLKRYEAKITEDKGYYFAEIGEVEQIGIAILAVANLPEQYSGRLWVIGEDVMLRVMLADLDAQAFYERFGYPAIARALRAALEPNEFARALSFLDTEFLPPVGESPPDRIRTLLGEPIIRDIFREAATIGVLRLEPEKFDKLEVAHHRALLTVLDYADDLALPIKMRLQWIALLHNIAPAGSEMHRRVSHLFLVTLLHEEHYLSLYYSLKALGSNYPDLWFEPVFRPMLHSIIAQALTLGVDGRRFLIEMCKNPEIARLAAGDFGSEFLVAALAQYATVRWGQKDLINNAWAVWDNLAGQYPTLTDVLRRQLQGEEFGSSTTLDPAELRQEYEDRVELIADRLTPPGYQSNWLAISIHRWFVNECMQAWWQRLQSKELSAEQVKRLLLEVSEYQQVKDLVEACPLQQNPPRPDLKIEPLEGRLKDQVNSRLFDLLELFQQAIKLRQQLLSQGKRAPISHTILVEELSYICKRSEIAAWAIEHLLKPELPFIVNYVNGGPQVIYG